MTRRPHRPHDPTDPLAAHGFTPGEQQHAQLRTFASGVMAFHHGLIAEGATPETADRITAAWVQTVTVMGAEQQGKTTD